MKKGYELVSGISNVFSIADDILTAGFDEQIKDHDETLEKVLKICRQIHLKLNEDKCLFMFNTILLFGEFIS